jgi:hypothetical protein
MIMRKMRIIRIGLALAVVGIVVAVIIIKNEKSEFNKIEAAVPGWLSETGCAKIEIKKPSPNTSFVKWAGRGATTASIDCEYLSGSLEYARYGSMTTLHTALQLRPHGKRLCVAGRTLLEDELADEIEGPGRFIKMCHNLHGIRYS